MKHTSACPMFLPSGKICAALPYRSNGHDTAKWRSFRGELCHTYSAGKIAQHRGAVLAAVLAGAEGSIGLMLRAGHRQGSRILVLLFGLWVLSPFVAAAWSTSFRSVGRRLSERGSIW